MFGLSRSIMGILGVVVLIGLVVAANMWENYNIRLDTRAQVQQEARERAFKLIQERDKNHAEISNMDKRQLCVELGGNWMQDTNTCD